MLDRLLAYIQNDLNLDLQLPVDEWHSLDINYEPPRVERVWREIPGGDARVCVHRIHPCEPNQALFHPHPWPSAVYVVDGQYEMGVGYSKGNDPPSVAARIVLRGGSMYEMVEPDGWHWVRPIGGPSLSVMITGLPWPRWSPGPKEKLGTLSEVVKRKLLDDMLTAIARVPDVLPCGRRTCDP